MINIKYQYFNIKKNILSEYKYGVDLFIDEFITVFERDNFFNEKIILKIMDKYYYRYEIYFVYLCLKFIEFKREIYNINENKIFTLKTELVDLLRDMNVNLMNRNFILNSNDHYIIKPLVLLKIWDCSSEPSYVSSHLDLNILFMIKTYIKIQEYDKAYNELKIVLEDENIFEKSQIFIYYFGKVLTKMIDEDAISEEAEEILRSKNSDNFQKIKMVLVNYAPNSFNYKKKAKNYSNLAKIAIFFNIDNNL
jgi:hypothetical protein